METSKSVVRESDSAQSGAVSESVAEGVAPFDGATSTGETDANRQTLQRMCIRIGDLGLLFESDAGREVIAPPPVSRIPNTAPWLRGLANVRGTLVPVIDASLAFGVTREVGIPAYLLIFGHGETVIGLLIDGLPRLLDIDVSDLVTDRPEVPRLLGDSVTAAYENGGRRWLEVDPDVLFDTLAGHVASFHGDHQSGATPSEIN